MIYEYEFGATVLKVSDLDFSYGDFAVVKNTSFEIRDVIRPNNNGTPQGQIVSILGESGIGKSTLLKLLAGLMPPKTGTIEMLVNPTDTTMVPAKQGNVGVVYQDYTLFPHQTVFQALMLGATQSGLTKPEAKTKVAQYLKDFGIEEHGGKYPAQLSGGQRQRVAIAQQLLLERQILILDEPFSGLDFKAKTNVMRLIKQVANLHEYQTVIIITHDIESSVAISNQVYIMEKHADDVGAHIGHTIDLMAQGVAWREQNYQLPAFHQIVDQIKSVFVSEAV